MSSFLATNFARSAQPSPLARTPSRKNRSTAASAKLRIATPRRYRHTVYRIKVTSSERDVTKRTRRVAAAIRRSFDERIDHPSADLQRGGPPGGPSPAWWSPCRRRAGRRSAERVHAPVATPSGGGRTPSSSGRSRGRGSPRPRRRPRGRGGRAVAEVESAAAQSARVAGFAETPLATVSRLESGRSRLATERVRYDYALCRLGISKTCPKRRQVRRCTRCPLFDVCLL
jgi:hypothetical protein